MPTLFLSPSNQEFNPYTDGGNEEYYMNLLADAMEPYLRSSGIRYVRNNPEDSIQEIVAQSNSGNYDAHLALHSNAGAGEFSGILRGADIYYYTYSARGKRLAEIIADNYKVIYPLPDNVHVRSTTNLYELRRTNAPAVLFEVGYHDNPEDVAWISGNLERIAANIVYSLTEYFGIPYVPAQPVRTGTVVTRSTALNIRQRPDLNSRILTQVPRGANLTVYGKTDSWYVVGYNNIIGYAAADYVSV